ncbi:MAG TPA: vWA domain-containing protein, partial [Actinomycetota bacterium]|nr:vWA domain-containing protein [Actinomycetota bacterium]
TPNSVAHGDFRESIVMSTGRGVYAWAPTVLNWVDLNAPRAGIRGLLADRTSNPSFYGHTTRTVEIYSGPTGEDPEFDIPEDIIEIPDISLLDVAPPDVARQTTLTPKQTTVRLDIGKRRTVTYDVGVPRTLTPLDVFFVVDTSSSMTQVIKEAAEALETIYRGLASSGAAVQFGLAEYRSYPIDIPPKSETDNYVYRRVLDVGSTTAQMEDAIEGLTAAGGGVYDAQLEALWQAATGNGADVWPPGPSSRDVPPGIQANFRKNALRVVLHVGDEPFGREDSASDSDNTVTRPESELAKPDIPEFETVAAALRANGVKQLGLSLYPDATPDLRRMADATGAFAPPGGVDCDRDGSTDVPAGEPLVCVLQQDEIDDANMAPAIVELVEAVRTKSSVGLKVDPERDGVLQSVSPDRYNQVLLQADSSLEFDVTYRCPESLAGKEIDVDLQATGLIGTPPVSQTRVVCAEIPPDKPPLGIPFDRFVALVPLIPIGPPPPPVNVSSATQAQAQAQANAAFAAQEQEQPQVAMVHQLHADAQSALAREEQYSFTSLRKDPGPPVELWGAALLMSAGFGVAMNTQRRTRLRFAKVRSRR